MGFEPKYLWNAGEICIKYLNERRYFTGTGGKKKPRSWQPSAESSPIYVECRCVYSKVSNVNMQ